MKNLFLGFTCITDLNIIDIPYCHIYNFSSNEQMSRNIDYLKTRTLCSWLMCQTQSSYSCFNFILITCLSPSSHKMFFSSNTMTCSTSPSFVSTSIDIILPATNLGMGGYNRIGGWNYTTLGCMNFELLGFSPREN